MCNSLDQVQRNIRSK